MKCFTQAELMEKLVEAYARGAQDARRSTRDLLIGKGAKARLLDMIHEDTGGHDGLGVKHG